MKSKDHKSADGDSKQRTKIDISLLQTFHLVAQTGSFSSASRELNISYQSAANHVRRLEQMYGAKLVEAEKGSRTVNLTPQGKALHASLGPELEAILSRISVLMHDVRSVLRIGVPQALFHHFFPRILSRFRRDVPDIEMAFFERDTTLEKMMLEGSLDVCISERFFGEAIIAQHLLGEYHLSLIYPREWTDQDPNSVDVTIFADRPFITYEPGQTIRSRALDYLGSCFHTTPNITTTASGSTSVAQLAEAGLGYAVVPEWSIGDDNPHVGKIILDQVKPVKVYYCYTAFLQLNELVERLHQACQDVMSAELRFNL